MKILSLIITCILLLFGGIQEVMCRNNESEYVESCIDAKDIGMMPEQSYVLSDTVDLNGKRLFIPQGVTIIVNRGIIKNGILVGNETKIKYKDRVFDNVHIEGTWIIPSIKSSMFCDLSYVNSLRDVFSLTNSLIHNTVVIEKGDYYLGLDHNADVGLMISDRTSVTLDGIVYLLPNDFSNDSIFKIRGKDIVLKGKGLIVGDRLEHIGNEGEWGMGVTLCGTSIKIKGISITKCWGDCIYVTGGSNHIIIEDCILEGSRRQGISVISADSLVIARCTISNIQGVDPGYAIDIEPNAGEKVGAVLINKVSAENCVGGFTANGRAKGSLVGSIVVKKCSFSSIGKPTVISTSCSSINIQKCKINQEDGIKVLAFDHIKNLSLSKNSIFCQDSINDSFKTRARVEEMDSWPCIIDNCENILLKKNTYL